MRYDVFVYRDRRWWMLEIPELGTVGQTLFRSYVPFEARALVAV
jgi:hypothetical protein